MSASGSSEFSTEQYEVAYPDGMDRHYWHVCRNQLIYQHVAQWWPGERILDVGCGRGFVVNHLRGRGLDAWGCELGQATPATAAVAPYMFAGTESGRLEPAFRASVTRLLLLDVVEHVAEPARFLRQLRAEFPAASELLVTVPARQELWSEFDRTYGHHRRYDRESLRGVLGQAGLDCRHLRYFFHGLYLPALAARRAKARSDIQAPRPGLVSRLHALAGRALYLESQLLPAWLVGTSLLARGVFRPES